LRQLGEAVLKAAVRRGRLLQELLPRFGQPKRQAAPIVGIGTPVDLPRTNQDIDGPANGGLPPTNVSSDLLQRRWSIYSNRFQKVALLPERPRRNCVAAKLLHQTREAFCETDWG
jgi:hypothetical protein